MKTTTFVGILSGVIFWSIMVTPCFAQSAGDCTVTSTSGSNLIIVSCPDGSRTVNVGGRADLYRVGDRVDIYGVPGNQPPVRPGETSPLGR